jgi:hypothetical protein
VTTLELIKKVSRKYFPMVVSASARILRIYFDPSAEDGNLDQATSGNERSMRTRRLMPHRESTHARTTPRPLFEAISFCISNSLFEFFGLISGIRTPVHPSSFRTFHTPSPSGELYSPQHPPPSCHNVLTIHHLSRLCCFWLVVSLSEGVNCSVLSTRSPIAPGTCSTIVRKRGAGPNLHIHDSTSNIHAYNT